MARADDNAAMEAMMSMDFDMESGDDVSPKAKKRAPGKAKTDEVIKVKTEPGQRKRRKVKHVVKEMNSKGYFSKSYEPAVGSPQSRETSGGKNRTLANLSQNQNRPHLQRRLKSPHQLLFGNRQTLRRSQIRPNLKANPRPNPLREGKPARGH